MEFGWWSKNPSDGKFQVRSFHRGECAGSNQDVTKQQDRRNDNEPADHAKNHQWPHSGDKRIGVVEIGVASGLPHQTRDVPGNSGDEHADTPQPQLPASETLGNQRSSSQSRPEMVEDRKIHDDDGATVNQVKMRCDQDVL